MKVFLDFTSGPTAEPINWGFDGEYAVTVTSGNAFTVEFPFSQTSSGNVSILPEVPARQNAGPGRRAAWCRTKRLSKEKSLACDSIESGGFDKTASIGRSMGKGLIIGYGKKDIRPSRFGQDAPIKNREEADEDHPCEDRRRHHRKIRTPLTTGNAIWTSSWPM